MTTTTQPHHKSVTLLTEKSVNITAAHSAAIQDVVDMAPRAIAEHHRQNAEHIISRLEHDIRDYGEDDELSTTFSAEEALRITAKIDRAITLLGHVRSSVNVFTA